VKDLGKPARCTKVLVPGIDKSSATSTETATWKNQRFDSFKTIPLGKDNSRATVTKTVIWKTPIVDTT